MNRLLLNNVQKYNDSTCSWDAQATTKVEESR